MKYNIDTEYVHIICRKIDFFFFFSKNNQHPNGRLEISICFLCLCLFVSILLLLSFLPFDEDHLNCDG